LISEQTTNIHYYFSRPVLSFFAGKDIATIGISVLKAGTDCEL